MKVRTKLALLLFVVIAIFLGGLTGVKAYDRRKFREVSALRQEERRRSFDKFIAHWSDPVQVFVRDFSALDEVVAAIAHKDQGWADANLGNDLQTSYHTHAVWAYAPDGTLAFARADLLYSEALRQAPLPTGGVQLLFAHHGSCHFFTWTPVGLMEISGAAVHSSGDLERAAPPAGYLFAGHLWSNADVEEMSLFTGNNIKIEMPEEAKLSADADEGEHTPTVSFHRPLRGWDGNPVASLFVCNDSAIVEQLQQASNRQFSGLLIFAVVLLLVLVLSLTRWVSRPVKVLSRGLQTQEAASLAVLQPAGDEFGDLARMMGTFFEQRLALIREISERRQVQEALTESEERLRHSQKMEAVGRLAGGIAHDFNNLLTAIIGYAELIGLRSQEETTREEAALIRKAGDQAADLTKQLLAFSRKQILQPRVLDLNNLVRDMQKLLRRVIGETIDLRYEAKVPGACVSADPTQLEQVLINLAVNARDAMPRGGTLTMRTGEVVLVEPMLHDGGELEPGRYLTLTVQDSGCGMSADTLQRIFEPFFTTKGPGEGTGLGLATVYGIVQQSGGAILVSSQVGVGTSFTIYLPDADAPLDVPMPPAGVGEKGANPETVLVVEDEMIVRELVCAVLQEQGYKVLCASCGADALALADAYEEEIDLVVSDVIMPQMTGPECARELLLKRPETKVLFISGYSEADISEDGVLAPGVNLLPKPFTPKVLSQRVREVLDGGALRRSSRSEAA